MIRQGFIKALVFILMILGVLSCVTVKEDWKRARDTNTIYAYEEFLSKHPNTEYSVTAEEAIQTLEWKKAQASDSVQGYRAFIKKYPQGIYIDDAKANEVKVAWKNAIAEDKLENYKKFISLYPDSTYVQEAKAKLENAAWEAALTSDKLHAYIKFIRDFPKSRYLRRAQSKALDHIDKINIRILEEGEVSIKSLVKNRTIELLNFLNINYDKEKHDATIYISVRSEALGANYTEAGFRYTAADIHGIFSLVVKNVRLIENKFSGEAYPPETIMGYGGSFGYAEPKDAPFSTALSEGDFDEKILSWLIRLKDLEKHVANLNKLHGPYRTAVIKAAGDVKLNSAVSPLIDSLRDKKIINTDKETIIGSLAKIENRAALKPIIELYRDKENQQIVEAAKWAIDSLAKNNSIEQYIDLLLGDRTKIDDIWVVNLLSMVIDERVIDPIMNFVDSTKESTMYLKVGNLSKTAEKYGVERFTPYLYSDNINVRSFAERVITGVNDKNAFEKLIQLLSDKKGPAQIAAVKSLAKKDAGIAVEPLIALLKTVSGDYSNPNSRYSNLYYRDHLLEEVVNTLGQIGDDRAIEPLYNLLINKKIKWDKCDKAVEALGKIGNDAAIDTLISFLKGGSIYTQQGHISNKASEVLGNIKAKQAVEALIALMQNNIRSAATGALAKIGGKRAIDALIAGLEDEKNVVFLACVLGKIKEKQATGRLIQMLNSKYEDVRSSAIDALGEIGDASACTPLIAALNYELQHAVHHLSYGNTRPIFIVKSLAKIGCDLSFEPLLEIINSNRDPLKHNWNNKYLWDEVCSVIQKQRVSFLLNFVSDAKNARFNMKNNMREYDFQSCALSGLEKRVKLENTQQVIGLLKNPNWYFRKEATEMLGNLGSKNAIDNLIAALEDKNSAVKKSAAQALVKIGGERARKAACSFLQAESSLFSFESKHSLFVSLNGCF